MLEESNRIDMGLVDKDGHVLLVVTDAGMTPDAQARLGLLLKKLSTYVHYIYGDKFAKDFPGKAPKDARIRIMAAIEPTKEMQGLTQVSPPGRPDQAIPVEVQYFPQP